MFIIILHLIECGAEKISGVFAEVNRSRAEGGQRRIVYVIYYF